MSFQNKNLYALLGNDVEGDEPAALSPVKELVKKNTSSKKADVPPPSADPAKANKNRKQATGNDAAFKNKVNNKSVSAPASTPNKHSKKPFDKHSRTGKTDSKKKVKQGWGDDNKELKYETEAAADAVEELEEQSETAVADVAPKKSLQDYFSELQAKQAELTTVKAVRKANEGAEDKWGASEKIEKSQDEFFSSSVSKKVRQKNQKEKKFLEINATFADQAPAARDFKKGPKKFNGKKSASPKAAELNEANFPSLAH
ncbi:uncharacterized protein KQ657_001982 [Scheffersomyces spartinae]|uniref:Hyaluronan/mRNA-binding protein domain-containing protein n=1 Tax=Scheffersomyces spartinae TaxID=45513 RepID=A0A9P7V6G7_9ASCO|nr:uncharacterized protein KQ657_001982 [Scheffersomyces spartinae]KAG7192264.1 hypothetical protein KQ657_001982 [Scheffersomyces spartinae]